MAGRSPTELTEFRKFWGKNTNLVNTMYVNYVVYTYIIYAWSIVCLSFSNRKWKMYICKTFQPCWRCDGPISRDEGTDLVIKEWGKSSATEMFFVASNKLFCWEVWESKQKKKSMTPFKLKGMQNKTHGHLSIYLISIYLSRYLPT